MEPVYFILNPKSQSGKSLRIWKKLKKNINIPYKYFYTRYPGHLSQIVQKLTSSKQSRHICIIGGDGSFNETINGIQNPKRHSFTFIPAGSGNDLCRSLKHSGIFKENSRIAIDSGMVQYNEASRRFAVSCGIGFDAAICHDLEHSSLKKQMNTLHIGALAYLISGLKHIFLWKPQNAILWTDASPHPVYLKDFFFLSAHIHPFEGGGFPFSPSADFQDDMLDLCVVSGLSRFRILPLIPLAKLGLHIKCPGVTTIRCKKAQLTLQTPLPVHTDGEPLGTHKKIMISSSEKYYIKPFKTN